MLDLTDEQRTPLIGGGFGLLLPLVEAALTGNGVVDASREAVADSQAAAFKLLTMHCEPSLALGAPTRRAQASLLLALLARGERWRARAAAALLTLAPALASVVEILEEAIFAPAAAQRLAALGALCAISPLREGCLSPSASTSARFWLATHDAHPECASRALAAWELYQSCALEAKGAAADVLLDDEVLFGAGGLLPLVNHHDERVRTQVAGALAAAVTEASRLPALLQKIFELYKGSERAPAAAPTGAPRGKGGGVHPSGGEGSAAVDDGWQPRHGVALCIVAAAPRVEVKMLPVVFAFLKRSLGDAHEAVAAAMVDAGRALIETQPLPTPMLLLLVPMLEAFLAEPATSERDDVARQGAVLLMGTLAKRMEPTDPKVSQVLDRLLEALKTPSEVVQRTVALSLAKLFSGSELKGRAEQYVSPLLSTLLQTASYAERRGAAFGLAGVCKGVGLRSLKRYDVMLALARALDEKKRGEAEANTKLRFALREGEAEANAREGALNAYECLCESFGRLFEPYVTAILPLLLSCVADGSGGVRHAAMSASQAIMGQLSAQGVKLVLPSLLLALGEDKWRTKHAAVELLGAMAYCAPRQLSRTLPQVVPALTSVLTHAHPRVVESAKSALESVGAVIRNPEISQIVPTLMHALAEPSTQTTAALDVLAHCEFEHCVDAPSLALIVPLLHRGLRERGAHAKRKTAHITGNMCSLLTERADIVPYLGMLLPELQAVLLDPIPEVRSTGGKALGQVRSPHTSTVLCNIPPRPPL